MTSPVSSHYSSTPQNSRQQRSGFVRGEDLDLLLVGISATRDLAQEGDNTGDKGLGVIFMPRSWDCESGGVDQGRASELGREGER